mmetsp:Transcript_27813/g.89282  ORF Transcript_27813/g.89282 Transcript_27813/m.89282 type:complete len:210 (-) Transcript_27813:303-932(-)
MPASRSFPRSRAPSSAPRKSPGPASDSTPSNIRTSRRCETGRKPPPPPDEFAEEATEAAEEGREVDSRRPPGETCSVRPKDAKVRLPDEPVTTHYWLGHARRMRARARVRVRVRVRARGKVRDRVSPRQAKPRLPPSRPEPCDELRRCCLGGAPPSSLLLAPSARPPTETDKSGGRTRESPPPPLPPAPWACGGESSGRERERPAGLER